MNKRNEDLLYFPHMLERGINMQNPLLNFHCMNKKLPSFLTIMIRTPWRSLSMFFVVIVISLSSFFLLTAERNILRALEYYEYSPLDERRFTMSADTDIFSLFSRDS